MARTRLGGPARSGTAENHNKAIPVSSRIASASASVRNGAPALKPNQRLERPSNGGNVAMIGISRTKLSSDGTA